MEKARSPGARGGRNAPRFSVGIKMTLIILTSDKLGEGDEVLGRKLVANFLAKLAESDQAGEMVMGFLNRAVFLAAEGSPVVETLRSLEGKGVRIRSCITCLEHYGLEDKLAVGEIGTMAETVAAMAKADKVITF
jgi:selenium metabolism protein YedF